MFEFLEETKPKKETFSIKGPLNKFVKAQKNLKKNKFISASKAYQYDPSEFIVGYFLGLEEVFELDDLLVMETGTALHKILQDALKRSGAMVEGTAEKSYLNRRYGFRGAIDGIVHSKLLLPKSKGLDELMHLEIKSTTDHAYDNLFFPVDIPIYYRAQAEIYQQMLGVKKTLFCFVNRANFSMKCLVYEYQGDLYGELCRKADLIWSHVAKKTLPTYNLMPEEEWKEKVKDIDLPLSPQDIPVDEKTTICG